ncbi:MAG: aryl-sulfate sulfotransferase [Bacteroidota bacterium]
MRLITLLLLFTLTLQAQSPNTVGIIQQDVEATYDGYNLIFPHNQGDVFLLDNCGQIVHRWVGETTDRPGNAVYLLENGNLVKCKRKNTSGPTSPIWAGGGGETVEVRTWENELLHSFTLNDSLNRLHHDVAVLPNGNILMFAWENRNRMEAIASGRDTALLPQNKVWSETIFEWNPMQDEIVWEWRVWDHLVQDYDETQTNFGNPSAQPERIDLNYDPTDGNPDWLHINAIAYNPVLDQIVLSVPHFDEIWVIDHSTTTVEAATSTGGNSGKGGDLLYRWGNPKAYGQGTDEDQQLFFQHDVQWLNPTAQVGDADFGIMSLFNNRLPNGTSSGNLLRTTKTGSYDFVDNNYLPNDFERVVIYPKEDVRAASAGLSSAQFLPNGNALLLSGRWGFGYEITPEDEVVWEYIIPLKAGRPVTQGEELSINNNITFRMTRYGLDYPAFEGKDLSGGEYWELSPNEVFCGVVSTTELIRAAQLSISSNPAQDLVTISSEEPTTIRIWSIQGELVEMLQFDGEQIDVDVSNWQSGIYFLIASNGVSRKLIVY